MSDSLLAPFIDLDRGRARFSVTPAPPTPLPPVEGLLAGAAEVDITPPPGLPKAGYSANAHDGDGFRTRLRARVLHLRSGSSSIAWVAVRPARRVAGASSTSSPRDRRARTDIPLAGLMIGATHTHAGPGQFLGSDFYNRFASNRSGFDPAWTDFLVEQITGAVLDGARHAPPGPTRHRRRPRCGAGPATGRSTPTSTTRPSPTSARTRSGSGWRSTRC